ncbi:MAG: sugar ABC transporter permease [Polyangiaceae bacterium]|jgi:multiple sugar transport system permease protein|nr:sugar ABC transporter permease [Polyangiaceae bacterium]
MSRAASDQPEDRRHARHMVAPAVVVLGLVAVYPICAAVWLSLHRAILIFRERRFVGVDNYGALLGDDRFWASLGHTLYFTLVAVSLEVALGLSFALLLSNVARGRGVMTAAVLVPWAIPTVVAAKTWHWLYDADVGLVARALPFDDVDLLGMPGWAMHAAILVDVWKTTPFVALLLYAGLSTIPADLYKAAAIDGAGRFATFARITLPSLRSTLGVAALLRALDAFRVFDAVYVLTEGGPANTTETLSIYAYKTLMRAGDFGYGSTLAVATFVSLGLLAAALWLAIGRGAAR